MGKDVKIGIGVALCIGLLLFVFLVIRGGNEGTAVGPSATPTPPSGPSAPGTGTAAGAGGTSAAATSSKPTTAPPPGGRWTTPEELELVQPASAAKERTAEVEIVGTPQKPAASGETTAAGAKSGPSGPTVTPAPAAGGVTSPSAERPVVQVAPPAPTTQTYTTQKGDTLWSLATRFYGDGRQWKKIYEANRDVLPSSSEVAVGVALVIPAKEAQPATAEPQAPAALQPPAPAAGAKTHTVEQGDTLYSIALKEYGDGSLWRVISEANRDRVPDPEHLSVGTVLVIPPAPQK